ncbi:MAG: thioredoxin reductase [Sphingomonas sp. 28-66-16]|nr:MAG: thioredoxin reductase [Sphingomonas sp. 28-66-16]
MARDPLDCLVIGAGPAGLTAAIYLARFHLDILVVDRGQGRARSIPKTHNHAGFPEGITGAALVDRMLVQAREFGAVVRDGEVTALRVVEGGFDATVSGGAVAARSVLLATGVTNNRPDMPTALHDVAVARNLLRYCPVCDGYEVSDQRIGVIGSGNHGAREALFLRSFTRDVTLIAPDGAHRLDASDRAALARAGIVLIDGPVIDYAIDGDRMSAATAGGARCFDAIYPALGSTIHGDLARAVGADVAESNCIKVDAHQRTSVPGLYAAGDVVLGLDQISHAMGEAGVAATAIRNDLNARKPLYR